MTHLTRRLQGAVFVVGALALAGAAPIAAAAPAHEHGVARLDAALEASAGGARLTLLLELPLDTAVGFERAPRTDAERQRLAAAQGRLRDGAALARPEPAAGCRLVAAEATLPAPGDGHADLAAEWRFDCTRVPAFVDLALFGAFPRLQRMPVQLVAPDGQRQTTLRRPKDGPARLALTR